MNNPLYENEIRAYLERNGFVTFRPKAALIDMDGTLYDSMPNHARAWHRMMTELGVDSTLEEFYLYEGRTSGSTINILFNRALGRDATPDEIKEYYGRKTRYFQEYGPVQPMPGAARLMDEFVRFGLKRVLVTGSGQGSLLGRIDEDYPGVFLPGMRVTGRDVVHGKPDPEPFLKAMELAGVLPEESIVIENAPLGVEAGRRSRAFTVGVTTGPIPAREMWDAGADVVFPSMEECADRMPSLLLSLQKAHRDV